jgi:hypothetical protein
VTTSRNEIENPTAALAPARTIEPFHNPSYPLRDHFAERARLEEVLSKSEQRASAAKRKLEAIGNLAASGEAVRLYHQLLGVRDQIAECVRRMPLETGGLYEEDRERFKQAEAALERVWQRWERNASSQA